MEQTSIAVRESDYIKLAYQRRDDVAYPLPVRSRACGFDCRLRLCKAVSGQPAYNNPR